MKISEVSKICNMIPSTSKYYELGSLPKKENKNE